jgi:hypothetical protein
VPPYRRGKQISMCGLVAYRHSDGDGEQVAAWMGFDLLEGAYDTAAFIRVLDGLGHQLGHGHLGQPRRPPRRRPARLGGHPAVADARVPAVVRAGAGPRGGLWANLKGRELANRCCADRRELIATAQVGSIRARRDPDLLRSFLAGTGRTI